MHHESEALAARGIKQCNIVHEEGTRKKRKLQESVEIDQNVDVSAADAADIKATMNTFNTSEPLAASSSCQARDKERSRSKYPRRKASPSVLTNDPDPIAQ